MIITREFCILLRQPKFLAMQSLQTCKEMFVFTKRAPRALFLFCSLNNILYNRRMWQEEEEAKQRRRHSANEPRAFRPVDGRAEKWRRARVFS